VQYSILYQEGLGPGIAAGVKMQSFGMLEERRFVFDIKTVRFQAHLHSVWIGGHIGTWWK